jgi:hypothetical protein
VSSIRQLVYFAVKGRENVTAKDVKALLLKGRRNINQHKIGWELSELDRLGHLKMTLKRVGKRHVKSYSIPHKRRHTGGE